jgi:hypothetical protein
MPLISSLWSEAIMADDEVLIDFPLCRASINIEKNIVLKAGHQRPIVKLANNDIMLRLPAHNRSAIESEAFGRHGFVSM